MSSQKDVFTKYGKAIGQAPESPKGIKEFLTGLLRDLKDATGGGGSGSTVSVTQIQSTGTKIATITVDDVPTDLYSPAQTLPYVVTSAVSAAISATTVTITDASIATTSVIDIFSQNTSGTLINVKTCVVTTGQAVLTFDALEEATSFILHVYN